PVIYKLLHSIDRNTEEIISGNMFVSLDEKGYIVEDEVRGSTGIDFYYKNWKKINYKVTGSETRKTKLNVLKNTPIDLVFVDRWLVMPAMLRDYNVGGGAGGAVDKDIINDIYSKIIRLTRGLKNSSFGF